MSNTIWVEAGGEQIGSMTMANSVTGHFLAMLILSGTALVNDDYERDLVVFLDWHDQHWRGRGNVDFCLNEMPWNSDLFQAQYTFLDKVVDGALARTNWDKVVGWTPQTEVYDALLKQFRALLRQLSPADLRPIVDVDWTPPATPLICPIHGTPTYGFDEGRSCLVCHI